MDNKTKLEFSKSLHTRYPLVNDIIRTKKHHYREITINKRNGKIRKLYSPSKVLRYYQRWIVNEVVFKAPVHDCCTSYQPGVRLTSNVTPHQDNLYLLCIDIEDFFTNISYEKVFHCFMELTHDINKAKLLTELCTLNDSLPQGAVSSPALSNVVNYRLDKRIHSYAKKHGLTYTRYADDITLSGNDINVLKKALIVLSTIIISEGYKINKEKTRITKPGVKRKVTGLILNDEQEVRVGRGKYRQLRSLIYTYKNSRAISDKERKDLYLKIVGWISYLKMVDPKTFKLLAKYIEKLYEDRYNTPFSSYIN